jgi:hypothetical protein
VAKPGSPRTFSQGVPVPKGLGSCAPSDPLAVRLARVAARSGGELVGCFKSEKKIRTWLLLTEPFEFAVAIDFPGPYTLADLEKLLATGIEQWKGFPTLSKHWENYTDRLNELTRGFGRKRPVLVSIGRTGANSFSVVSLRSNLWKQGFFYNMSPTPKVNASADVLRGSRIVRLTVRRALTDPSDIAQVQSEIAEWVNAVSSAPAD